jgi:cytochrome P450
LFFPPKPKPDIALKLHVYHAKFSRMYPTPYKFWLGLHPSYVFGDAEGVRRVLLTQLHKYDRNPLVYKAFDPVATGLILMPNGEQWKHDRKMFDVAFKYENIKKLVSIFLSFCVLFVH